MLAANSAAQESTRLYTGRTPAAWRAARQFLSVLAAKAGDEPTLSRFGGGGAGHFVKMVHNGIEYAIMQAIAECHGLLTVIGGLGPGAVGDLLERWNASGRASGFLLEITAEIASTRDPLADGCLLAHVSDVAGQKGTGAWSVEAGLAYGVPVPSITKRIAVWLWRWQGAISPGRTSCSPA